MHASQEEEPFVIELVVIESPTAQGSPAKEQQQLGDQDVEDKTEGEYPPPSDTTPRYGIKEVPRPWQVQFKAIVEIFLGSRVLCRHKGPAFRASHSDGVANAAW
jgi:hypothetical protein